ncbi:polyprenyl synthetase family protein [Streptomyces monashensis]|uniref:Geranylgeranyl diphosphate synthase n=1 Tax=Streptomyces monashensis TaxID=1678012 RepID=A0A1S2QPZ8_9ACTN|nr:polyprenyl synthetase family protein [Streptomyces monashensis]OIK08230.1 geranylgeranyl diphosphate synthase [Streptomyces monashensis]
MELADLRARTDTVLNDFLAAKARTAAACRWPDEVTGALRDFLFAGGKRIRPLLCVLGWHAAGGQGSPPAPVLATAASLEMFHTFALIHDDIMDGSDIRRGQPTVHQALAARYTARHGAHAADRLGAGAAVLIGDLALAWSDELLHTAGLSDAQLADVLPLLDAMRTEVMYGQYLDLTAAGLPTGDLELAMAIARYKTAKYSVERPLHIGAALAAGSARLRADLSAYALPVGEAFQLRDDLLGAFGAPEITGKPALDDIRQGKHTALLALAWRHATPAQQHQMNALLSDPDMNLEGALIIRSILIATGARDTVESMITARRTQAEQALARAGLPPAVATALRELATTATARAA